MGDHTIGIKVVQITPNEEDRLNLGYEVYNACKVKPQSIQNKQEFDMDNDGIGCES